jgi:uncharacterized protein YbjT (DUF2867 family)
MLRLQTVVFAFLLVAFMTTTGAAAATPQEIVGKLALSSLQGTTVLLAGATSNNGSAVREQQTELGVRVRAMSRNGEKAREKYGDNHDWVSGDVTKPETLGPALEGVDVVIWAVATARPWGGNRPEMIDYQGVVNLATAAKEAGATRMVMITSSNSGKEDHFLNWIGDMLIWKGKGEEFVMNSGLEYVVVGPAAINFEAGGKAPIQMISRADYAAGQTITSGDLASVVIAATVLPKAANRVLSVKNGAGASDLDWQSKFSDLPPR